MLAAAPTFHLRAASWLAWKSTFNSSGASAKGFAKSNVVGHCLQCTKQLRAWQELQLLCGGWQTGCPPKARVALTEHGVVDQVHWLVRHPVTETEE
jgi:hypothetical protein